MRRWRFQGNLGQVFKLEAPKPKRNWRAQRQYRQTQMRCEQCGAVGVLETDHIVPLWKGGKDELANRQALCVPCHSAKSAREAGQRGR